MRLATALLLAAVPTCAAAQPASPPAARPPAKSAAKTPPKAPQKTTPVPTVHKPAHPSAAPAHPARKPVPAKPAAKPVPVKPEPEPTPAPAPDLHKGSNTGLPLPRFAALKTDDVNFRRGPGMRYPIDWVYKRRDLPVEIEREFEVWRLVTDPNGGKGWVQAATLTGRRTAIISGAEHVLRQAASETAAPVAKLDAGVIVRLRTCEAKSDWCQVQINDYHGFLKRTDMWGIEPAEVIP